jgi:hypothetical protein
MACDWAAAPQAPPSLPGLRGLAVAASVTHLDPAVPARAGRVHALDPRCTANASGGLAITGQVAGPAATTDVVLATFDRVIVVDAGGATIADASTGFPCVGSSDRLDTLAIGDARLDRPVIAIAATSGTETETTTRVALFQLDAERALIELFSGDVIAREGVDRWYGEVTISGATLVYRPPGDPASTWTFDRHLGRYVEARARSAAR